MSAEDELLDLESRMWERVSVGGNPHALKMPPSGSTRVIDGSLSTGYDCHSISTPAEFMPNSGKPTLAIGESAPELQLKTTEGTVVNLKSLLGVPALVTFLSHAA